MREAVDHQAAADRVGEVEGLDGQPLAAEPVRRTVDLERADEPEDLLERLRPVLLRPQQQSDQMVARRTCHGSDPSGG